METATNQFEEPRRPTTQQQRIDDELWQLAKARASFKWNLASYFFMNCFFIAVWYFSSGYSSYFWPIWPMLGWGIGVAFHYFGAYHSNRLFNVQDEYEKLKNQQKQ